LSRRAIILRRSARRDIDEAVDFYIGGDAHDAAYRLVDELETALAHLAQYPESGSPKYAQELNLPGLRHWSVAGYPYLVVYVAGEDQVDVWRVLHAERDIPEWLGSRG